MAVDALDEIPVSHSQGRVAKNAGIYLAAQIVSWAVTFASLSIIPRALGKTGVGQLAIITNAFAFGSFLSFGIDQYLLKEVGRDRSQTERLFGATIGLRLITLPISLIVSFLTLKVMNVTPDLWLMGTIYIIGAMPSLFADPVRFTLAGLEQARRVAMLDLSAGVTLLFAIPFLRYGPKGVLITQLVMAYLLLIWRWSWIRQFVRIRPTFDLSLWRNLIRGGLPFIINVWILNMFGFLAVFLLRHYTDEGQVGLFANGQKLYGTLLFVPVVLGTALLPSLSRLADRDKKEFRLVQSRVLALLIVLGLPVTTITFMLASPISHLLFGDKYAEIPPVIQMFALAIIPVYIVSTMYQFLIAQGRNGIWSYFLLTTVALFAALCSVLIPYANSHFGNGAAGAALSTVLAESSAAILSLILLGTNPFTVELVSRIGRALLATAGMAVVLWFTKGWFVFIPALLGMLTFVLLAWALRVLTAEEQQKLVGLVRRKLGRVRSSAHAQSDPAEPVL